jgi:hypothetical protein
VDALTFEHLERLGGHELSVENLRVKFFFEHVRLS